MKSRYVSGATLVSVAAITVQPTVHLVLFAVRSAPTPSARRNKYFAEVKRIEGCAR